MTDAKKYLITTVTGKEYIYEQRSPITGAWFSNLNEYILAEYYVNRDYMSMDEGVKTCYINPQHIVSAEPIWDKPKSNGPKLPFDKKTWHNALASLVGKYNKIQGYVYGSLILEIIRKYGILELDKLIDSPSDDMFECLLKLLVEGIDTNIILHVAKKSVLLDTWIQWLEAICNKANPRVQQLLAAVDLGADDTKIAREELERIRIELKLKDD